MTDADLLASPAPPGWWREHADDLLADVLLERTDDELSATLDYLWRTLGLVGGARVFDQGAGIGSLSIPLALRGVSVVGVDLSSAYCARAEERAHAARADARFVTGDAFEYKVAPPCDAAFNWWTSFGYADTDRQNRAMLDRVFESLVPGGRFVLDFMNAPGLLRGFLPRVVTERETPAGEVELTRETAIDLAKGRIEKVWTYRVGDRSKVHRTSVRLYQPHELVALFDAAGFTRVRLEGGTDGHALTLDSPRCLVVAERPA